MMKKDVKKGLFPYLMLLIVIICIMYFFNMSNNKVNVLTYDEFVKSAGQ